jgi:hypothetical protein
MNGILYLRSASVADQNGFGKQVKLRYRGQQWLASYRQPTS